MELGQQTLDTADGNLDNMVRQDLILVGALQDLEQCMHTTAQFVDQRIHAVLDPNGSCSGQQQGHDHNPALANQPNLQSTES